VEQTWYTSERALTRHAWSAWLMVQLPVGVLKTPSNAPLQKASVADSLSPCLDMVV